MNEGAGKSSQLPDDAKGNPEKFAASIEPLVQAALAQAGLNPRMATAMVAQIGLETGYGRSIANGNVGGIKADRGWQGPVAHMQTSEFEGGQMVNKAQPFRAYSSLGDGVADYVRFLVSNPRYQAALAARTPSEFFAALQSAGYATDPQYASKLAGTFKSIYGG